MRRFLREQRGVETVEAAVTLPLMVLILLTIVEFGWAVYAQQVAQEAARHGVRMGVVSQGDAAGAAMSAASSYAASGALQGAQVSVLAPGGVVGTTLRVRVRYDVPHFLGFMGLPPLVVTGEAEGKQEGW
ncbi:MAG: pilus assembly protein [Chloroflexi bacterium]|nr:pilus assembly protein [Chloroflexota bacterium]